VAKRSLIGDAFETVKSVPKKIISPVISTIDAIKPAKIKPVLPGTNWCGHGDKADSIYDLGIFHKTG
jgi:Phospholipase A2